MCYPGKTGKSFTMNVLVFGNTAGGCQDRKQTEQRERML